MVMTSMRNVQIVVLFPLIGLGFFELSYFHTIYALFFGMLGIIIFYAFFFNRFKRTYKTQIIQFPGKGMKEIHASPATEIVPKSGLIRFLDICLIISAIALIISILVP